MERRAVALAALGPDAALMILYDLLADAESEAGAVGFSVCRERLEEILRDRRGDALAGILDGDGQDGVLEPIPE